MTSQKSPWRQASVYQIYPWTFNEDKGRQPQLGNGSIKGITEKLDYLKNELGVDAVWLSPFYASPMADGGYDISDYCSVHPHLGTVEDFDEMMAEAHRHGVRVMIDLVTNHTSNEHEWFEKSRRREDGYDDWYIWHAGKTDEHGNLIYGDDGKPLVPNNWPSVFSMSNRKKRDRGEMPWLQPHEWTPPVSQWYWDDLRGEYYLHTFAVEQPDLNWSNPYVRAGLKDVMRYWLDKGVDGFRVDAINHVGKDMSLQDEEVNTAYNEDWNENPYDQLQRYHSADYPEALHKYIWEMAQVFKEEQYAGRDIRMVLEAYVGEAQLRDMDAVEPSYAKTFNFGRMLLDWNARNHKVQLDYYYARLHKTAVGNQVNGNHDNTRVATRLGDERARAAFVINLFLPGMTFIYNGEELGLHDANVPQDKLLDELGYRDPERTPIIWDDAAPNAGFSDAPADKLWLPVNSNDLHLSLTKQRQDSKSSFNLYVSALKIHQDLHAVQHGVYTSYYTDNDHVLVYGRTSDDSQVVVLANFSDHEQTVRVSDSPFVVGEMAISSLSVEENLRDVDLRAGLVLAPHEAVVVVPREPENA